MFNHVQMLSVIIHYPTQKTPASVQGSSVKKAESGNTIFFLFFLCLQILSSNQLCHQVQQPNVLGTAPAVQQVFLNKMVVNVT